MQKVRMTLAFLLIVATSQSGFGQKTAEKAQQLSKRDRLKIATQEICPISGNKLGEHGSPLKVKVGKEAVFVCCKGCLQNKIDPKHWATIHANFAKAQQICPVMKHKLPKKPKWTIIEGQIVYVCCPPCTKKIQADPEKHLQQIDQLYTASLKAKAKRR